METISNRIIQLVDCLGGNKSEFARKINVTPGYISKLGKNPEQTPSERTIIDICKTFNVSYEWLKTGQGEMFEGASDTAINALANAYNLDNIDKEIVSAYVKMSPQERKALTNFIKSLIK